jgi:hypothetical protein
METQSLGSGVIGGPKGASMWWTTFVLWTSNPGFAATPDTAAVDAAHEALAAGDAGKAIRELRAALAKTTDDAARARV